MAVTCPGCGWQYDVTLFPFGRTINCACGERVGPENRITLNMRAEPRFFADVMLHRLVRLLRAAGFDTVWEDAIPDAEIVRRSLIEQRQILTLDRRLSVEWRVANILLLTTDEPVEQMQEVILRFGLHKPAGLFTRCLVCNTPLRAAAAADVESQVPAAIRGRQAEFRYCPNCRKVYWQGSHTERMRSLIDQIFGSTP